VEGQRGDEGSKGGQGVKGGKGGRKGWVTQEGTEADEKCDGDLHLPSQRRDEGLYRSSRNLPFSEDLCVFMWASPRSASFSGKDGFRGARISRNLPEVVERRV